ncbi:uncharacterized protein MYCFIDRAFT_184697 [Pseudocercospora fijiensis CIRAD86]|uniref:AAA+ ATPase domain-containing protein n=1 Tax=Pseudocercospora fijiensis (strain CIRAD86) TaxID=383855 RepID=N1Q7X4_PSEFD|nr:uncharacterized protein MYCFIDRAFT_184697 [Pseudocercospora fijiensis CIRAD86]EME87811.1 hypothetical protein MYCFIDRAFT_184697 [Pseudocercospora fijiensis CIRAD86]
MRLQGALAVQKFLADGVAPDVVSLYTALQRSNSALKRRPKKTLQASLERVLEFIGANEGDEVDSDTIIEDAIPENDLGADIMNRSLRANLSNGAPQNASAGQAPTEQSVSVGDTSRKRRPNGEALPKRQKVEKINMDAPSDISFDDVGGMDDVIDQLADNLIMPFKYHNDYRESDLPLPKGIMLHGPPGCGKTMLVRAMAAEMGVPFVEILGPAIVSGMSGESEKGIRERFEEAKKNAPCLIFIDEIDAIAPKRESSQSQMEKRIVAQLLVSMDELQRDTEKPVIVLAATNRPDSIDPALRRGGRFGTEINIGVPNEQVRRRILETQTRKMKLATDVDFTRLAKQTAGFVGADLHDLVGKAGAHQMRRLRLAYENQAVELNVQYRASERQTVDRVRRLNARADANLPRPEGFEVMQLAMEDFQAVLPVITPSSKREGFATIPDVSWKDIGALATVREEIMTAIVEPIAHPELYDDFGEAAPSGVLLWGPPGCGKTLLAKAAAAESKANFISIKGPELLNKFVGESEAAVRKVFQRARSSVPCVIFFDEFDALVPKREDGGSEASSRVVNTLLTELDGLNERAGIYVIAATNRPEHIDSAMLRPGRLGTHLFVDLPGPDERVDILRAVVRNKPCEFTPQLAQLVREECHEYSGADLGAMVKEAVQSAIKRRSKQLDLVDFQYAAKRVKGSVHDAARYNHVMAFIRLGVKRPK